MGMAQSIIVRIISNPLKGLETAHAGSHNPGQMIDVEVLGDKNILGPNHVGDGIFGKFRAEPGDRRA